MWIVFEKSTLRIVGLTAHCRVEQTMDQAIRGALKGRPATPPSNCSALLVTDDGRALEVMHAQLDRRLSLESAAGEPRVVIRPRLEFRLSLASDAPDVHPVDGVPEIPADGKSSTLITLQKRDGQGEPVRGKEHNDELFLRTDNGTLQDEAGRAEISRLRLKSGKAAFRLRSDAAKRIATVSVFNGDRDLRDASIRIEFI